MSHRSGMLKWVLCVALASSFACGDDSGGPRDAGDAGPAADSGTNKPRQPFVRPDAGTVVGMGEEGSQCATVSDCAKDLTCVGYDGMSSFCARGCASDADCGSDICFSYSGLAEDAFCANTQLAEFGACGPTVTSLCGQGRSCLRFAEGIAPAICVDFCVSGSDADGGVTDTEDAGALPDGLVECRSEQTCIPAGIMLSSGVLAGFCGESVKRGAECGLELGLLCEIGDVCAPADSTDPTVPWRCYQDCTERGVTCDNGTCTPFRGQLLYCL